MNFTEEMTAIQVDWATVGTWVGAFSTAAAVIVALWSARRTERVKLVTSAGFWIAFNGDGTPPERYFVLKATNAGERPVHILSTGWCIGKRKSKKRYFTDKRSMTPAKIEYGETAQLKVNLEKSPEWMRQFAKQVVQDGSNKALKTLRAQIHTSVLHTENVVLRQSIPGGTEEGVIGKRWLGSETIGSWLRPTASRS